MAELSLSADDAALIRLVGPRRFIDARRAVIDQRIRVTNRFVEEDDGDTVVTICGESLDATGPLTTITFLERAPDGSMRSIDGECDCRQPFPCDHVLALAVAPDIPGGRGRSALPGARPSPWPDAPHTVVAPAMPDWERHLTEVLADPSPDPFHPFEAYAEDDDVPCAVGLQFELQRAPLGLTARPVSLSASGNWVRSEITWTNLAYARVRRDTVTQSALEGLRAIVALLGVSGPGGYSNPYGAYYGLGKTLPLERLATPRLAAVLLDLQSLGVPMLQAGKNGAPVTLHRDAQCSLGVEPADSGGLLLRPRFATDRLGDVPLASLQPMHVTGEPHAFAAWWDGPLHQTSPLNLALLPAPAASTLIGLLDLPDVTVPEADRDRFLSHTLPTLRRTLTVRSTDASLTLPQPQGPRLLVTVTRYPAHRTGCRLSWRYTDGTLRRDEPFDPPTRPRDHRRGRDLLRENEILQRVTQALGANDGALGLMSHDGLTLRDQPVFTGLDTVTFHSLVVPVLQGLPGVQLELLGDEHTIDYREAPEAPVVEFRASGEHAPTTPGAPVDWLDLSVTVTVGDEPVPFESLFRALATGQDHLILPSGTWFRLDGDAFARLARLIEESRALTDADPNAVRISRFQLDVWGELEQLGVVDEQAAAWQGAARELLQAPGELDAPLPLGLKAELRPYQRAGYSWLAALHDRRLGGILADDMGLGKTLQTLALVCRQREAGDPTGPFLVVAPTSVASNWAREAAHFAPDLRVVVITETQSRRGVPLADLAAGADLVVTSYALFRLEYDHYEALPWSALVLDEAQFVKNHQGRTHVCARRLPVPVKIAITGTPMENNLMELWSLLSIVAPGLFARPDRFTEYYRGPIEQQKDPERLALLRRRIKPLVLRRTKEQVATDLPDKQEQVLELDLVPAHRTLYQKYLSRERQKVLGLLDDFDGNRFEIFRSLTLLRQLALSPALVDDEHAHVPSTKLDAALDLLRDAVEEGHRVLVFSQFTRFLGAVRERLQANGIEHCYLDGTTRRRADVIERFRSGDAPVFLISLKAGGFGLNLTEADYCLLLDPWWNPAAEAQAVDRAHRIGQTRKVMVYRLVARDTIEEKVMALKASKAALVSSVMDGGDFDAPSLSAEDIRGLFD